MEVVKDQEGQNPEGQKKLSYEELNNVAIQLSNQVNEWKQRAYAEAGKVSRISLIVECLKIYPEYEKLGVVLFESTYISAMANELIVALYPPKEEETKGDN